MFKQTIREALLSTAALTPGWIYVIRDGEVIFYIGISNDPTLRLAQHLGIVAHRDAFICSPESIIQDLEQGNPNPVLDFPRSPVGVCILDNAPSSLEWSFDIFELEDAIDAVKRTGLSSILPFMLDKMKEDYYEQKEIIEPWLIAELKPYLNVTYNSHERDLPEKYRARKDRPVKSSAHYLIEGQPDEK